MNDKLFHEDLIAGYSAYVSAAEVHADGDQSPGATPTGTTVTLVGTIVIPTTVSFTC
ncbi:LxmA leader domain family RiPP [Streptomyces sp. RG80]|uniref:LxmA leader domain family RiPP n=1 Tax=Streptomyces sp. RG80 TaxID=3157340 RepID=UPI00338D42B3